MSLGLNMGLTYAETLMITPGELFDLAELRTRNARQEVD